jgi:acetyltransferase-like isoleucine patch superfamily enzyme
LRVIALDFKNAKTYKSKGSGKFKRSDFKKIGENVIFEDGVRAFHPESISIGDNVHIGHDSVLEGYHKNEMVIGNNTWIGHGCFFHSAGGIRIGKAVGIGPNVKILTSVHKEGPLEKPIIHNELEFGKVTIGDGSDIGMGAILLPGVKVGKGAIVGAGSIVTKDVEPFTIVAGNPAKLLRARMKR